MTREEAIATFTDRTFLYGYEDDPTLMSKETIEYIINEIYDEFEREEKQCLDIN